MAKDYSTFNLFTQALYDPKTLTIPFKRITNLCAFNAL